MSTIPLSLPRIRIPHAAKRGEVIEIRTLMQHTMESGIRHDGSAAPLRNMLNRLQIRRDGTMIFAAELRNGTATNPYHTIFVRMESSAEFTFTWTDEQDRTVNTTARVMVT